MIVIAMTASMLSAAMAAFWFVTWPFTPEFVINRSPWTEPQLRALMKYDPGLVEVSRQE